MVDVRCMSACRSLPWPPVKAFAPPIFSNCFKASVVSAEESCADSGGNSLTRIRVHCAGGVSTRPATGGFTLQRSIVAGAPFVFHTSKKRGPFGPIGRCSSGLVSLAMMAMPLSLWPVTMRRKDFDILPILRHSDVEDIRQPTPLAALDRCESRSSFPHSNRILTLDRQAFYVQV